MAKKEMLEAKRALRVGFDFALGMMRAAAQGTTTFVDVRKRLQFPESASVSVVDFLQSAVQGAKESLDELKKEREEQNREQSRSGGRSESAAEGASKTGSGAHRRT